MEKDLDIPKSDNDDFVHFSTKFLLNLLSAGTVGEIFGAFISPPIEKRREGWMKSVVEMLKLLEETQKGIVQHLSNNEEYISLVLSASLNAFKTHLEEKHQQFRNALLNSVFSDLSYDEKQTFINLIDQLTIPHVRLLQFFGKEGANIFSAQSFQEIYSQSIKRENSYIIKGIELVKFRFLLKDLESRGLLYVSDTIEELSGKVKETSYILAEDHGTGTVPVVLISEVGQQFLDYISN